MSAPTWKICRCSTHANNVAVITTAFYAPPSQAESDFVLKYAGRLVCFNCGGEVSDELPGAGPDHVTATVICSRLKALGVL